MKKFTMPLLNVLFQKWTNFLLDHLDPKHKWTIVSDTQLKSNLSYVEIARNEGCEVVSGQHLAEKPGYFQDQVCS